MNTPSFNGPRHILLADDDDDDRLLFTDVLKEFAVDSVLSVAHNGEHLMTLLREQGTTLPDVLFLDLNMPLKNGIECLDEIRADEKLRNLPVVIFSTSSHPGTITRMYEGGAHLYIRKPNDFKSLRSVIHHALSKDWKVAEKPSLEEFVVGV